MTFKGYVMASEFAGYIGDKLLSDPRQHTTGRYKDLPTTMAEMKRIGYAGIEVAPFTSGAPLDEDKGYKERVASVRKAADESNGIVTGLHWILSFLNAVNPLRDGLSLFQPTTSLATVYNYYVALIDYCSALGGTYLVHGSPPSRRCDEACDLNEAMNWVRFFYNSFGPTHLSEIELLEYAKQKKVRIGFEPLATNETNFINTVSEGLELANLVDHPNFGITIDVKAMAAEGKGESVPDIIRSIGNENVGKIVAVHFNDPSLTGPGLGAWGKTEFEQVMGALAEMGWEGYITIEPFKQLSCSTREDCEKIYHFLKDCEKNVFKG